MRFLLFLACCATPLAASEPVRWASLSMRFVYDGVPPQPQRIADRVGEGFCGDLSMVDESLIVDTIDKGIRDLVVYAYEGPGGCPLPAVHPDAAAGGQSFELANVNCNYVPRVLAISRGDALSIVNTDVIGYSTMLGTIANQSGSFSLPPGGRVGIHLPNPEPAPIPIDSILYPWMKARLLVLEHRYVGISDKHGRISIDNLPVGTRLALRIYHERANLPGLMIGDSEVNRRGVFEVTLQPGGSDLGTIAIPAKRFGG